VKRTICFQRNPMEITYRVNRGDQRARALGPLIVAPSWTSPGGPRQSGCASPAPIGATSAPGGRVSSPPTRLRGASIRCPSSHRNFVVTRSRHQINDVVLGRRRDLGNVVSKRFGMRKDYVLRLRVGPNTSVDLSSPPVSSCESRPKLTPRSKVVVGQWSQIIPEILDLW